MYSKIFKHCSLDFKEEKRMLNVFLCGSPDKAFAPCYEVDHIRDEMIHLRIKLVPDISLNRCG
jgi:hypothetical protein